MATYQPAQPVTARTRESIPDLIRKLYEQVAQLIQQEKALLKEEGKATAKKAGQIAAIALAALSLAWLTLLLAGITVMFALAETGMDMVFAALITMVIALALTGIAAGIGYWRLKAGYPELMSQKRVKVLE